MNGTEFAAAVGGEFLGAFVGAVLVWLHFLPHFKTVPTPYSTTADSLLLKGDTVSQTALGIASYNVRVEDVAARKRGLGDISHAFADIKYYLKDTFHLNDSLDKHATLVEVALGPDEVKDGKDKVANRLRRRSVQVCDIHRRLKDIDIEDFKAMLLGPELYKSGSMVRSPSTTMRTSTSHQTNINTINVLAGGNGGGNGGGNNGGNNSSGSSGTRGNVSWNSSAGDLAGVEKPPNSMNANAGDAATSSTLKQPQQQQQQQTSAGTNTGAAVDVSPMLEKRQEHLDKLYEAAVVADRNVKLSIFATRPAIYSPLFNFLCEFMCTTALIYGALMIYARRDLLYGPERMMYRAEEGIWIAFFVFLCILGLGGPTGIAANPARDFSPRLAHALLPVPGKGSSEFYYSWIPFFAPFVGGCAAAGLYHVTQFLNNSIVPSDQVFPVVQ